MPDSSPLLPLAVIQSTLGSPTRWAILRELADGGSLMVSELAKRIGGSPSAISKQLAILIADGLVINPRGRLFEIPERFLADKANRTLDFGWCLLHMNVTQS
ncbi:MAG TPA: helix-turn-helix domain-containing protein [Chthoniobacterales bacterium]|nr:helix-turn-helix domain-containing protein [Chthoniobacterales bacterium]